MLYIFIAYFLIFGKKKKIRFGVLGLKTALKIFFSSTWNKKKFQLGGCIKIFLKVQKLFSQVLGVQKVPWEGLKSKIWLFLYHMDIRNKKVRQVKKFQIWVFWTFFLRVKTNPQRFRELRAYIRIIKHNIYTLNKKCLMLHFLPFFNK